MGTDTGSEDASCDKVTYTVTKQYPVVDGCDFNNISNWGKIVAVTAASTSRNVETDSDIDILNATDTEDPNCNDVTRNVEEEVVGKSTHEEVESDWTPAKSESECTDSDAPDKLDSHHNRNERKRYPCTFEGCGMSFIRPWRLSAHLNLHLGQRPFKCPIPDCGKDYINNSHLRRHIAKSHTPSTFSTRYKCPSYGCEMELANLQALRRHVQRRHETKSPRFPCTQCAAGFHKNFQLADHVHLHHGSAETRAEPRYVCATCCRGFNERTIFRKHARKHRRDYKCRQPNCRVEMITWSALRRHVKEDHPAKWLCNICDREFASKTNLRCHKETHASPEQRSMHACQYPNCNKEYTQQRNLIAHITRCHFDLKFVCVYPDCNTRLSTKQKLANHIATIHEGKKQTREVVKKAASVRKDANVLKRSMVSKLLGIGLPACEEKKLLNVQMHNIETVTIPD